MRVRIWGSRHPADSERQPAVSPLMLWSLSCFSGIEPRRRRGGAVLDEAPAVEGEWGYRPGPGTVSQVTPPGFTWRPTQGIVSYELECGKGTGFQEIAYRAEGITMNVHCPPRVLPPGVYTWRYRGKDAEGQLTPWSQARTFEIAQSAVEMPLPTREELLARVPKTHPHSSRCAPRMSPGCASALWRPQAQFDRLVSGAAALNRPRQRRSQIPRHGAQQRGVAQDLVGNRTYTIAALDSAATLAFTRLIGGRRSGQLARRIPMECAKWNPKGSTGYRYNDEVSMPYNWASAAPTLVNDLLTDEERAICRRVMKIRGDEMCQHLYPRLWRPTPVIATVPGTSWARLGSLSWARWKAPKEWVWFAANVFANVYPVWSDDEGGWHGHGLLGELPGALQLLGGYDEAGPRLDLQEAFLLASGLLPDVPHAAGTTGGGFWRPHPRAQGVFQRASGGHVRHAGG